MRSVRFIAILSAALCLVSCSGDPKVRRQRYLESGNKYYERAKYPQASLMYRNSIKADPKFGEAYYHLALVQLKMQQGANALSALHRAIELLPPGTPDALDANVKMAEILLLVAQGTEKPDQAAKLIDEVVAVKNMLLKKDPNSFEGLKLSAEISLNEALSFYRRKLYPESKSHLEEAVSFYRKALQVKPGEPAAMLAMAKTLTMYGELSEAEQLYKQVIDKDKTNLDAYVALYKLYIAGRKYPEAESVLKRAIATHQTDYSLQTLLASHYFSVNNRPEMTRVLNNLKSHYKDYPDAFIKAGDFYFRIGDADQAMRQYEEGISADKARKLDYQKRIIELLVRQGKTGPAYEKCLEILKENPKDPEARGLKASFLLDKGEINAAATELASVVTLKPNNFVARFNLGRAYFAKGDLEQARQQFEQSLRVNPNYMPARLALTQIALRRGDADAALKMAQESLRLNPSSGVSVLQEASAYMQMKNYPEARARLEHIIKGNPNQADTLIELGILDMMEKKYKDAEDIFRRAYAADPSNLKGLMGVAEVHFQLGEQDKALKVLTDELQKQPQRPDLRKELGNVQFRAKMYDQAIENYKVVLNQYKDSAADQADITDRIGESYRAKGDMSQAIEYMKKAHELAPSNVTVLGVLANLYDTSGKRQEALTAYRDAMKIDPNNAMVLNNLAFLMSETNGNLDEALTLAQRSKQQLPGYDEVSDTIGWIYLKKNLADSAAEIFKDLTGKSPTNATFHYHYAMALAQKGDRAGATRELKLALQNKPRKDEEDRIKELMSKVS